MLLIAVIATSCSTASKLSPESKCKYQKNEVDDMTGKRVVRMIQEKIFKKTTLFGPEEVKVRVSNIDGTVFLSITSYLQSDVYSIREGNTVIIRFVDGTVMELENYNSEVADYKRLGITGEGGTQWYATHKVVLSGQELHMLRNNYISKIRLYSTDGYDEFDIKRESSGLLMYQCGCVVK